MFVNCAQGFNVHVAGGRPRKNIFCCALFCLISVLERIILRPTSRHIPARSFTNSCKLFETNNTVYHRHVVEIFPVPSVRLFYRSVSYTAIFRTAVNRLSEIDSHYFTSLPTINSLLALFNAYIEEH